MLCWIAVQSPALARMMGLELINDGQQMRFVKMPRRWLCPHPVRSDEVTFNPEGFAQSLGVVSSGERHMMLWLLNVWNPTYAKSNGWQFDLFEAMHCLDSSNMSAITQWISSPVFP